MKIFDRVGSVRKTGYHTDLLCNLCCCLHLWLSEELVIRNYYFALFVYGRLLTLAFLITGVVVGDVAGTVTGKSTCIVSFPML